MRMLSAVLLGLSVMSCGGGSSSDGKSSASIAQPGLYEGTLSPSESDPHGSLALITSDGRVAMLVGADPVETLIGTLSNRSLKGTLYSSSVASATGDITSTSGSNIDGGYSSMLGGGDFSLVRNSNLSSRGADLSRLEGVWKESVFTKGTGASTWTIQKDGSFSMDSTSGCSGSGQFSLIDPSINEYDVEVTITDCPSYNGTYSGFGTLADSQSVNDTLFFVFNNGSVVKVVEPVKQ